MTGLPPYYSHNQTELFDNILNAELSFPSHAVLSDELKDFFHKILQKEVSARFQSFKEILNHPWVAKGFEKEKLI